MTESEGKKLEGLARSIDALFSGGSDAGSTPDSASATPTAEPELLDVTGVDFTPDPIEGDQDTAWLLDPVGDDDDPPGGDLDLDAAGSLDLSVAGPLEFGLGGDLDLDIGAESMPPMPDEVGPAELDFPSADVDAVEPEPEPVVVEAEAEVEEPEAVVEEPAEPEPPSLPDPIVEPWTEPALETASEPPPLPEPVVEETVEPPPLPEPVVETTVEPPPPPMETELGLAGIGSVEPALAATGVAPALDGADDGDAFVPTPLDEAVDAYLSGDVDAADRVRELAEEFEGRLDLNTVARAAERLVLAAGDPPDPNTLGVGRSIAGPRVLGQLVRRMGAERSEERRAEYYTIARGLGQEAAEAIRTELGETTTDRLARRIYCEALTEMGPTGRRMIESMVEDENQFIVRNAISILGDTGGPNAVSLVTSALANSDRRVRREALKSLAKLGDPESGDLVLGLLDDSDEEVREAAAVAAGELRVDRALRPLLKMLDEAKNADQSIPIIRALGQIGDPGAVNSIEKFAVPGLLRRPRTDVRIAAYRALHQIGTPHAKQLLLAVAKDKDEDVKEAVKGMLYG